MRTMLLIGFMVAISVTAGQGDTDNLIKQQSPQDWEDIKRCMSAHHKIREEQFGEQRMGGKTDINRCEKLSIRYWFWLDNNRYALFEPSDVRSLKMRIRERSGELSRLDELKEKLELGYFSIKYPIINPSAYTSKYKPTVKDFQEFIDSESTPHVDGVLQELPIIKERIEQKQKEIAQRPLDYDVDESGQSHESEQNSNESTDSGQ